jgi:hypothetical protein
MRHWKNFRSLSGQRKGTWSVGGRRGVPGTREGRYDWAFVRWCRRHGHLCVRTVNLYWAFEYHGNGFPRFSTRALREAWQREKDERKRWLSGEITLLGTSGKPLLSKRKQMEYANMYHPDPGPWAEHYKRWKAYYKRELARYQGAASFWKACEPKMRRDFLRSVRYSNRVPEAYPDYLVRFRTKSRNGPICGFVEVKGPRESLRPSQRRFFPELVKRAGQCIWMARFETAGGIRLARFDPKGGLQTCSLDSRTDRP